MSDWTKIHVDGADLWPRYYFDTDRAKMEVEEYLRINGVLLDEVPWAVNQPPRDWRHDLLEGL